MEWDNSSALLCRWSSQKDPCIVYFSPLRRPEGGGNYLVAHQHASIIAPRIVRMAAVNIDAGVCAAVGGQVLMLIKCVSLNHLCALPAKLLWKYFGVGVCVCHFTFLFMSRFTCMCVSRAPAGYWDGSHLHAADSLRTRWCIYTGMFLMSLMILSHLSELIIVNSSLTMFTVRQFSTNICPNKHLWEQQGRNFRAPVFDFHTLLKTGHCVLLAHTLHFYFWSLDVAV